MSTDNKNTSLNQQDHPYHEGQQNNIPPAQGREGQRRSDNNSHSMSDMMNESPEQKAGQAHGQKDESRVQQEEGQP